MASSGLADRYLPRPKRTVLTCIRACLPDLASRSGRRRSRTASAGSPSWRGVIGLRWRPYSHHGASAHGVQMPEQVLGPDRLGLGAVEHALHVGEQLHADGLGVLVDRAERQRGSARLGSAIAAGQIGDREQRAPVVGLRGRSARAARPGRRAQRLEMVGGPARGLAAPARRSLGHGRARIRATVCPGAFRSIAIMIERSAIVAAPCRSRRSPSAPRSRTRRGS